MPHVHARGALAAATNPLQSIPSFVHPLSLTLRCSPALAHHVTMYTRQVHTAVAAGKTSLRGGPLQDYESLPGQIHKLAVVHSDIRNVSPIRENEIINEVE